MYAIARCRLLRRLLMTVVAATTVSVALGAEVRNVALVPRPAKIEVQPGTWRLTAATRVTAAGAATAEARKLADILGAVLGSPLPVTQAARAGDIALVMDAARKDLGEEGYDLSVSPGGVRIVAAGPAGLFYGGQTLRQLLPTAAWRKAPAGRSELSAPCVRITDKPRFGWRGLLLDPARHFLPKASVLQMIDAMALHKLNRLQLHLTDDQGWRIELRGFPRLTERSSWRDGTLIGRLDGNNQNVSPVPHGGFYSQDDAREIVAYAAARHIVVVPEIEMPGHTRAWLAAYPEYAVFPEKAAGMPLWTQWGVSKDVLAPRPATLEACRRLLDELCELFPSPWIHTGGDEAPRDQWRESKEMQDLIARLGVPGEDGLQAWFTAQLSRHLASKGRRLIGWDEILAGAELGRQGANSLDPGAIVMSWRGEKGGEAAASAGHDVIMTPNEWTYLDYYQGPPEEEPLAIGGSLSLARAYAYDPVPAGLPASAAAHILGSQAQVWSEYLPGSDAFFYMTFPRACALAEAYWSPAGAKDLPGFLRRMEKHEARLVALGIPYRPLGRRVSIPDASGRVTLTPADAVSLGTDIVKRPDGALSWKDPYSVVSWTVELPAAGQYRLLVSFPAGSGPPPVEAVIAGEVLRPSGAGVDHSSDMGVFKVPEPGRYLLFVRAGSAGGATVSGGELRPER